MAQALHTTIGMGSNPKKIAKSPIMGNATHSGTPAEIPVPDVNPELMPDQSGGPGYQPEIEPDRVPSPASPQSPGTEPEHPIRPGRPNRPDDPTKPDHPTKPHSPEAPHIRPDIDPDMPEKPGPPLNDPENPHGKY
jgi:hypothetical protein